MVRRRPSHQRIQQMVLSGPLILAAPIAAAAGAITFISPCCLPLVPGYLAYATGMSGTDAQTAKPAPGARSRRPGAAGQAQAGTAATATATATARAGETGPGTAGDTRVALDDVRPARPHRPAPGAAADHRRPSRGGAGQMSPGPCCSCYVLRPFTAYRCRGHGQPRSASAPPGQRHRGVGAPHHHHSLLRAGVFDRFSLAARVDAAHQCARRPGRSRPYSR